MRWQRLRGRNHSVVDDPTTCFTAARPRVVVFLEVRLRKRRSANAVELGLAARLEPPSSILVDSRAFMSLSRSIASSRSLSRVSYLSFRAVSPSAFWASASSRSALNRSRYFSMPVVASITANCFT